MLSISQKAVLLNKINQDLLQLEATIYQLQIDTQPISPENSLGRVSRMDAIHNKSVAEQSLRQTVIKQKKLEEAKHRIKDANFGLCFTCKKAIAYERLLVMPEARSCVACLK